VLIREEYEALEEQILAPYAMKSKHSKGRKFEESLHPFRTCYQRDRDRIVHSEAFRKLEYKTQVFVIIEGDYYRTRLTHTIEVAQIARTIGRSLRLNEDLIEAIALAHDLGHPPFGHAGEEALNKIMEKKGGFNHNKRSYDVVTKFEKRYPDFDGLNLTREVLTGILKHKSMYDIPGVDKELEKEGTTLEAQVVDVADSLAYLNHDVDDGLTSGCITAGDLTESGLWCKALEKVKSRGDIKDQRVLKYQIVKELIDAQVKDLLAASNERVERAGFKSSDEVKQSKAAVIGFSDAMKADRKNLQDLLYEKFYNHPRICRMTSKAKRIIGDLFKVYVDNPNQLPYEVNPRDKELKPNDQETYELVCNYIASMTDRRALDEQKSFFDPYEKV